ncbi:MAG: cytochrome c-type biogenesis CcmF C-terminal domain-containing protein, partial [Bacteroidota bacterium]
VIFMVSAIQITLVTSLPVFNTFLEPLSGLTVDLYKATNWAFLKDLTEANMSPVTDIESAYHRFQVPLAFLAILLVSVTQFLKWKDSKINVVVKKLARSFIASAVVSGVLLLLYPFGMRELPLALLLFACVFAVFANLDYLIMIAKGHRSAWGSSVAHIGFALVILGALISTGKKDFVSKNVIGDIRSLNEEMSNSEDMLLLERDTLPMGEYFISYRERYTEANNLKFVIDYFDRVPKTYNEGDAVYHKGMVFMATARHEATPTFDITSFEKYWTMVPPTNEGVYERATRWVNGQPGEKGSP